MQWSCTTPTIVFVLSKISDLKPADVALTVAMDVMMVATGYLSCILPPGFWSGGGCRV